jgi:hypothetical protein
MGSMNETMTQAEADERRQHKRELDRQRGISDRVGRPKGSSGRPNAPMTRIKLHGFKVIDRRTQAARSLLEWRDQLVNDLGGAESVSAQRMALIDMACRTKAIIDHIDFCLLGQPTIVRHRRKTALPLVMQRQTLCDSLARMLNMLGLDRIEKRVSLTEYLVSKKGSEPEPASE